jgi:hypothetical protein
LGSWQREQRVTLGLGTLRIHWARRESRVAFDFLLFGTAMILCLSFSLLDLD